MDAYAPWVVARNSQISLYFSLLAGNLAGERFAADSVHRHTVFHILDSKHKWQNISALHQFSSVASVARIASIPTCTLDLHDNGMSARQRVLGKGTDSLIANHSGGLKVLLSFRHPTWIIRDPHFVPGPVFPRLPQIGSDTPRGFQPPVPWSRTRFSQLL